MVSLFYAKADPVTALIDEYQQMLMNVMEIVSKSIYAIWKGLLSYKLQISLGVVDPAIGRPLAKDLGEIALNMAKILAFSTLAGHMVSFAKLSSRCRNFLRMHPRYACSAMFSSVFAFVFGPYGLLFTLNFENYVNFCKLYWSSRVFCSLAETIFVFSSFIFFHMQVFVTMKKMKEEKTKIVSAKLQVYLT